MKTFLLPLIFFLIGFAISLIGALFKIMHWPGANNMLITGTFLEAISIFILILLLIKKNNGTNQ